MKKMRRIDRRKENFKFNKILVIFRMLISKAIKTGENSLFIS